MLGSGFTFARSDSTASKRGSSRCEARPATGCERIGGLVGIGSSAGTYLVLDLYSQARLPTGFVSHYQWANGGPYYYVAPARVTGLPSSAGREHILRVTRLRPSSTWLVEVDNHVVDHIELPGSSRGLPMPTALLYASNQDGRLNRGLFRFTQVHALAAGGHIDFALFSAAVRSH
jgi:hypothetical protein